MKVVQNKVGKDLFFNPPELWSISGMRRVLTKKLGDVDILNLFFRGAFNFKFSLSRICDTTIFCLL